MIIEGKHSELGRGVFVSDIQEGSPAETAGLSVGDMILCVNQNDLIGADYETVSVLLRESYTINYSLIPHILSLSLSVFINYNRLQTR